MENQKEAKPILHIELPRNANGSDYLAYRNAFHALSRVFRDRYDCVVTPVERCNIIPPDNNIVRLVITNAESAKAIIKMLDDGSWRDGTEHKFPDDDFDDNKEDDTNDTP